MQCSSRKILLIFAAISNIIFFIACQYVFFPGTVSGQFLLAEHLLSNGGWNTPFADREQPMILLLFMPAAYTHLLFPASNAILHLSIWLLVIINACMLITYNILERVHFFSKTKSTHILVFLYYMLCIFVAFANPAPNSGQREQLFAALICPYIFNTLVRTKNAYLPKTLRIIVSILAAIAICLKPHFLIFYLVTEIYIFASTKKLHTIISIENVVIISIGLLYLISWRIFYPEYFSELHFSAATVKDNFTNTSGIIIIASVFYCIIPAMKLFIYLKKENSEKSITLFFFGLIICACIITYLQMRGYTQHWYLVHFFIFLFIAVTSHLEKTYQTVALLILLSIPYIDFSQNLSLKKIQHNELINNALNIKHYTNNDPITLLTIAVPITWTQAMLINTEVTAPIRGLIHEFFISNRKNASDETNIAITPSETYFRNKTINFMLKNIPKWVLIVHEIEPSTSGKDLATNVITPLLSNAAFHMLWKNYRMKAVFPFHYFDGKERYLYLYQYTIHQDNTPLDERKNSNVQ